MNMLDARECIGVLRREEPCDGRCRNAGGDVADLSNLDRDHEMSSPPPPGWIQPSRRCRHGGRAHWRGGLELCDDALPGIAVALSSLRRAITPRRVRVPRAHAARRLVPFTRRRPGIGDERRTVLRGHRARDHFRERHRARASWILHRASDTPGTPFLRSAVPFGEPRMNAARTDSLASRNLQSPIDRASCSLG